MPVFVTAERFLDISIEGMSAKNLSPPYQMRIISNKLVWTREVVHPLADGGSGNTYKGADQPERRKIIESYMSDKYPVTWAQM